MKLKSLGKTTLAVEVTHISMQGIWLLVNDTEYYLPFDRYPWFEKATIAQIHHVQLLRGYHLRWPELDIDLELDSLVYPEKYTLYDKDACDVK